MNQSSSLLSNDGIDWQKLDQRIGPTTWPPGHHNTPKTFLPSELQVPNRFRIELRMRGQRVVQVKG
jgi:hypothetical protein